MLIKTIAYKFASSDASWKNIPLQNQSAVFDETFEKVRQGPLRSAVITAYVPHITDGLDLAFEKLAFKGGLFVAITPEQDKYYLGSDAIKATFVLQKVDGGPAGSKSGYNITISVKSASGAVFKSFLSEGEGGNIVVED